MFFLYIGSTYNNLVLHTGLAQIIMGWRFTHTDERACLNIVIIRNTIRSCLYNNIYFNSSINNNNNNKNDISILIPVIIYIITTAMWTGAEGCRVRVGVSTCCIYR